MRGCGARHATRTRVPSSAGRRGGGTASAAARRAASCGEMAPCRTSAVSATRRPKHQRRRRRGRPREAHAAAHLRIVPVDAPSKADQPPELRLLAVLCGLVHGLAHRDAHRVRRALQAFARSDTCGFGGARGSAVTLERRRRALSRGAHAARPHAPRSSGGRGGHGARASRGRSKRPRRAVEAAATPGSRGPEQVVWACEAAGEAGNRALRGHWVMRARTRGLQNSRPLALTLVDSEVPPNFRFGGMKRFVDCIVYEVPEGGNRGVRWALSPGPRARTSKRVPRLCLARSSARATRI